MLRFKFISLKPTRQFTSLILMALLVCGIAALGTGCSAKSKADKLQEQGMLWYNKGKYYKAIERFQEVLEQAPERTDTLALLADCYLNTTKPELAIETAQKVVAVDPGHVSSYLTMGQAYLNLATSKGKRDSNGELQLDQENLGKAQEITAKLNELAPNAAAGLILQGKIDNLNGRAMTAERQFRRAREIEPTNLTATLGLVEALLAQRKIEESEQLAREELKANPENSPLVVALARALGAQNRFKEAIDVLEPGIADDNQTPDFSQHLLAGQLLLSQIAHIESPSAFADASTTQTGELGVLPEPDTTSTSPTQVAPGRAAEREAAVTRLAHLGSVMKGRYRDRPESYFFRGASYQFQGDLVNASSEFDRAVSLAPSARQYLMAQGLALMARKEYLLARNSFRNILQYFPTDFEARTRIAQCLLLEGSFVDAASLLEKLSFEQPQNQGLVEMRARALLMTDDPKLVEQGLALLTRTADAGGNVAGSADFAKGLSDLKEAEALSAQKKFAEANAKLASAEQSLRASLEAQPNNHLAAVQLAQLAERRGDSFEALRYLQLAARQEPALLDRQAMLFARLGQAQQALAIYRKIQAESPSLRNELKIADLLTESMQDDEADRFIEDLIKRYPNEADPVLRKGVLIGRRQTIPAGLEYLMPQLEKFPDSVSLRIAVGRLLFLANRAPEAVTLLEGTIAKAQENAAKTSDPAVVDGINRALLPLYQELVVANLIGGQGVAAQAAAQKALALASEQPGEFHLLKGVAQIQSGALAEALTSLGEVPQQGEPAPGFTLIQTLARAANGDKAGALQQLDEADRVGNESQALYRHMLDSTDAAKLKNLAPSLALQLYLSARPLYAPASLDLADKSLAVLPEDAFLLTRKAEAQQLAGKKQDAYQTLLKLQALRPDSIAVLLAQADVQETIARDARFRGEKAEAEAATRLVEEAIRGALKIDQEDGVAQQRLSLFLQGQERIDEANQFYQELIKRNPENSVAHNNLAWNLAEAGSLDEASKHAEEALRLAPNDGGVMDTVGLIELKRGNHPRALELLEKAVRLMPRVPTVRLHYAMALEASGQKEAAVRTLETLLAAAPGSSDAIEARTLLQRLAPSSPMLQAPPA